MTKKKKIPVTDVKMHKKDEPQHFPEDQHEIIQSSSENTSMEVHHHPHVEKKSFKEYLLEGLMIFLAVTMGFFAESFRESVVNHEKEEDYIKSMVVDLKADTVQFEMKIKTFKLINQKIDTMLMCLKSDNPDVSIINRLVSENFWNYTGFSYSDRTIEQLKNSGNFRLIRNKAVADSILFYDNLIKSFVLNQYNDLKLTMMSYKDAEARVIHYRELTFNRFDPADFNKNNKPTFVTKDNELIAVYYNKLFTHAVLIKTFIISLNVSRLIATRLINFIEKEYK